MSILGEGDIIRVVLVREINGKKHVEKLDIREFDVRWLSTPQLLRHFSSCIATATERLDLIEEFSTPSRPLRPSVQPSE